MNVSNIAMYGIGAIVVLLIMVYVTASLVSGVVGVTQGTGALATQTGILGLAKTILDFLPVLYVTALIGIPSGIGYILYKKFGGGRKGM